MTTPPDRTASARTPSPADDERRGALLAQTLSRAPTPPADLAARAVAAALSTPPVPRPVDAFVAVAARFFVGAAACAAVAVVVLVRSSSVSSVGVDSAVVDEAVTTTTSTTSTTTVSDEPAWHAWRAAANDAALSSPDAWAVP